MHFDYKISYSRRRTVSLIITRDGSLKVRAPKQVSRQEIEKILDSKSAWIKKHLDKFHLAKPPKKEFIDNETFRYLGKCYPLRVTDEYRSRLLFTNDAFYLSKYKIAHGKKLFLDWYVKQAAEVIFERAKYFAGLMRVKYKRISITSAQTRWGSCSSGQTINFTFRLVLAPLEIIDSVVVHEMAHLVHHNHSQKFWSLVYEYYPTYKQARKWLKENGHLLQV